MKLSGKQPRLLPDVMQAIVDLREGRGSTQQKIMEHIQSAINEKKITPRPRNITMQVRRALKHGIENGLLTQRAGKFQLGIKRKDFAVYKLFRHMEPLSGCNKCRKGRGRRGRRRRRKRRRRRRRRSLGERQSDTDISTRGTPEPMDGRRRRRRRRGRRRRRRRGRRRSLVKYTQGLSSGNEPEGVTPIGSKEIMSRYGDADGTPLYRYDENLEKESDDFRNSYVS